MIPEEYWIMFGKSVYLMAWGVLGYLWFAGLASLIDSITGRG